MTAHSEHSSEPVVRDEPLTADPNLDTEAQEDSNLTVWDRFRNIGASILGYPKAREEKETNVKKTLASRHYTQFHTSPLAFPPPPPPIVYSPGQRRSALVKNWLLMVSGQVSYEESAAAASKIKAAPIDFAGAQIRILDIGKEVEERLEIGRLVAEHKETANTETAL